MNSLNQRGDYPLPHVLSFSKTESHVDYCRCKKKVDGKVFSIDYFGDYGITNYSFLVCIKDLLDQDIAQFEAITIKHGYTKFLISDPEMVYFASRIGDKAIGLLQKTLVEHGWKFESYDRFCLRY